jgi:hypothetical protein
MGKATAGARKASFDQCVNAQFAGDLAALRKIEAVS